MKKLMWLIAFAVPVVMISCQKDVSKNSEDEIVSAAGGNGAPSGPHYNLNIIGVPKGKSIDSGQGNGHRIFVPLTTTGKGVKILLREGDFAVLDPNGTDGSAAFQLPEPDANNDDVTDYSVFVRGLGKPGGQAFITNCVFDAQLATEFCNTGSNIVDVTSHGNLNKFQNVTLQLLYVWADVDGDGDLDRVPLFADPLDEYYWYYDNNGLKIAQLRFYPGVGTNVPADPEPQ